MVLGILQLWFVFCFMKVQECGKMFPLMGEYGIWIAQAKHEGYGDECGKRVRD